MADRFRIRILGTAQVVTVAIAACDGGGLSDAQTVWCGSREAAVGASGELLDVAYHTESGSALGDRVIIGGYSYESQTAYDRACRAAFEPGNPGPFISTSVACAPKWRSSSTTEPESGSGQHPSDRAYCAGMRRIAIIPACLAVLVAACSSGLTDAEAVWCGSHGDAVGVSGDLLGVAFQTDSGSALGDRVIINQYSFESRAAYERSCRAAHENRDSNLAVPSSSSAPSTVTTPTSWPEATTTTVSLLDQLKALPVWAESDLRALSVPEREDLYLTVTRHLATLSGLGDMTDRELLHAGYQICQWLDGYGGHMASLAWDTGVRLQSEEPETALRLLEIFNVTSTAAGALCPQWQSEIDRSLIEWVPPSG